MAIKVPRGDRVATGEHLDRFLREARSVAQLQHPSIVAIHEVGQLDWLPYLVSDFVSGNNLATVLKARRLASYEAAQLLATVTEALQYAHERGVIHRDLKPSNIMMDDLGRPHVMDFGLAKRDTEEASMTVDGQVLGTPAYMNPEQARGESRHVDCRTDIYSLGVIFYQLLTGVMPFRGEIQNLLHKVLNEEPCPPQSVNSRVPFDLETICIKAMSKESRLRYQTAGELASDTRRFLNGVPITARPVSRRERLWRFCRRNPITSGLSAAVVLTVLVGTSIASYYASRATDESARANQVRQDTLEETRRKEHEERLVRRHRYIANIQLAQREWNDGGIARMCQILTEQIPSAGQEDLRGFEWYYLWRLCHVDVKVLRGHTSQVRDVAYSPDGTLIASASRDLTVKLWDAKTYQEIRTLKGHTKEVWVLALSKDGNRTGTRLFTSSFDKTIKVWDAPRNDNVHLQAVDHAK